MMTNPSARRMNVSIIGGNSNNASTVYSGNIMDINISERPDLIPKYLCTKLCHFKNQYISQDIPLSKVYEIVEEVNLPLYFKDGKEYSEDIKCLLYHDLLCRFKSREITVFNTGILYDLLQI